ncbi:MAG: M1 family metallopeptidase [Candidatus Marinimicrobia bacterium]|nr:M1 family metallopeptidase [Candidatus Neomarinimicrobiota bacterium]MBL7010844.1 M1 family metallopeptidase [Candidatus Neomarinimicrobiota bacterium]MBL7031204.1 M1 family metallopeptidase [Candidatus Neomarinimicrobiota bacterium]
MKFNKVLFALIIGNFAFGISAPIDNYPKNPKIDAINYIFTIELSDETDEIICETKVDVRYLEKGIKELRLDLINVQKGKGMKVSRVTSNGGELTFTHKNDELYIILPSNSMANQRSQYTISYRGIPAAGFKIANNKYGDRTFFSDNWPNKARHWLPLIDHPYDKAMCEFVVTAPDHYQVISNGLLAEETDGPNGKRLTHWKQSVPIAPWLFVLGVAQFAVQYVDTFDGKSIQTWVYEQDRDAGFYDFAEPTKQVLEFYTDYIGPFVYEKLANIQSNSVGGGMESASAIFYGDKSVTGKRSVRWRNVIIHEIAHQWFGNAVTEYDWDDIWLSEGFATYFTLLFIEHQYGRDAFVDGLKSSQKRVNAFYKKRPDYTIVHDNLKDMTHVTTGQIYQKGSWVLHMLRGVIGTENFWKGIQSYYAKYQNLNATTDDFRREMEEASGMDLSGFFKQWLNGGGTLKYAGNWVYKNGRVKIKLDQVQNDGYLFNMPLQVGIYKPGETMPVIKTIQVNKKRNSFTIKVDAEPEKIILDPNLWVLMEAEFEKKE